MKKIESLIIILILTGMISCNKNNKTEITAMEKETVEIQQPKKEKKTVIARVFVKEGQEAAFIEAATTLLHATRAEEGNISYTLYQSTTDPKEFIFYEEYNDEEAFAAHGSSEHFAIFANSISEILAKDLIIEEY